MAIKGLTTKSPTATLTALVASEIRAQMGREMMSGRALARKLGTTQNWVATRVKGEVPIDLNDLQRIAEALNVPWRDLLPETSAVRSGPPTVRKLAPTEKPMIPHPRVSHQPFGGPVRTRPLDPMDQMTEPNRVVPANLWANRPGVVDFDPAPPAW